MAPYCWPLHVVPPDGGRSISSSRDPRATTRALGGPGQAIEPTARVHASSEYEADTLVDVVIDDMVTDADLPSGE